MRGYHDLTERGRAGRLRDVVTTALERYDLEPAHLRLITNETNGVFRLDTTDGRRLVVRVGLGGHIGHSEAQVEAETDWLVALAEQTDLTVPLPLAARDGRRLVTAEAEGVPDQRNVVVFTWLSGSLLHDRISLALMRPYGALMAALHVHGAGHRPRQPGAIARYDRVDPFDEPWVLLDLGGDLMPPARRAVYEEATSRVEGALATLRESGEPMRVLHGDLHPWNVMAGHTGLAPFDFEDLMWGWPVQDVATALWYLHDRPEYPAWAGAFREGYETIATWPERRPGEVDTFLMGRSLVLGNSVVIAPEYRPHLAGFLERREAGLRRLLGR